MEAGSEGAGLWESPGGPGLRFQGRSSFLGLLCDERSLGGRHVGGVKAHAAYPCSLASLSSRSIDSQRQGLDPSPGGVRLLSLGALCLSLPHLQVPRAVTCLSTTSPRSLETRS